MNIQQAMKQAQAMQSKMADLQKNMESEIVEGTAGGNLVTVKATCKGEVMSVNIDPSLIDISEKDVLEDLIVSAFNNAKKNADAKMDEAMKKLTSSMGLPPGMLNFPL